VFSAPYEPVTVNTAVRNISKANESAGHVTILSCLHIYFKKEFWGVVVCKADVVIRSAGRVVGSKGFPSA